MRRLLPFLFFCCFSTLSFAQDIARPKLVVGIAIDQMRWDYLNRYYDRYGADGFKRILGEGYNCQNTFINYIPSFTAPGHACIYTGSVPSIHGIAANDWIDNRTGRSWYCTDDTTVQSVGGSWKWGRMSPKNMLTSTIGDELRLATNFRSKVFGVSLKDRASILPAGHAANGAFWFDDSTGRFITSTHYMKALPEWLNTFNNRRLPDTFLTQGWDLLQAPNKYRHSLPDNTPYEGLIKGESAPVFPHKTAAFVGVDYNALRKLPAGNTLTLRLARACIDGEALGQKGNTDFLAINLASTDYAGHNYTPNALEMEDLYMRLDKDLASFLSYLDKTVGKGQYLLFITADHGAAHNAQFMKDRNLPAGNANERTEGNELNAAVKKAMGTDSLILSVENYQVYLNEARIERLKIDREAVKRSILQWLRPQAGVSYAVDMENMDATPVPAAIRERIINGYNRNRSGCIQIIMNPGWYSGGYKTGTTHGTWNPYDTHIPLLWFGWNIRHGETFRTTYMTDIAATLAALLHVQMPNGCIGSAITEITK